MRTLKGCTHKLNFPELASNFCVFSGSSRAIPILRLLFCGMPVGNFNLHRPVLSQFLENSTAQGPALQQTLETYNLSRMSLETKIVKIVLQLPVLGQAVGEFRFAGV